MTIEEKANAYNEAIGKAAALYKASEPMSGCNVIIETLFPELVESKDEKIRKAIISGMTALKDQGRETFARVPINDCIAWLEKQGDQKYTQKDVDNAYLKGVSTTKRMFEKQQKSADKVKPKFKVGDWCIDNDDGTIFQIVKVLDNTYTYKTNEGNEYSCTHYSLENVAHLWTIQDVKDGDILYHSDTASNGIFIFKELLEYEFGKKVICYCDYDSEDGFCLGESHTCCWANAKILHPATKEQRDLLFQEMKEAGYEWDVDTKELKKVEEEEYNDEDYGIDGLYHAQRILEETLGKVDGYQSDDGILEHKCAITAVKKLYEQKLAENAKPQSSTPMSYGKELEERMYEACNRFFAPNTDSNRYSASDLFYAGVKAERDLNTFAWSEEDEKFFKTALWHISYSISNGKSTDIHCDTTEWLKSLKQKIGG